MRFFGLNCFDMDREASLAGVLDHVCGASGRAIPDGYEGVRVLRHYLVALMTGSFELPHLCKLIPLGVVDGNRDLMISGKNFGQGINAVCAARNDMLYVESGLGDGLQKKGIVSDVTAAGNDNSHVRSFVRK